MKNLIFLYFLIFSIHSFSQKITGKILNKDNIALSAANIYLDGTTISTLSDENGNFTLDYDPKANNILVISFVGYESEYVTGFDIKKDLIIHLSASKNELKEVIVNRKDMFTRAQKLKMFKAYFIGKTQNSEKVIIQNEDDIYFKYDKQNFILKAFTDKSLIIINPSLGYKISYDLQNFEVRFRNLSISSYDVIGSFYAGSSYFEEIKNSTKIAKRREKAYKGSQINFFRNLASSVWSKEQFLLIQNNNIVVSDNCFKITKEEYFTRVEVLQQSEEKTNKNFVASYDILFEKKEQSHVIFETDTFNIYKYGNNSNIENIIFSGVMAEERIGEMLPLNYGIN